MNATAVTEAIQKLVGPNRTTRSDLFNEQVRRLAKSRDKKSGVPMTTHTPLIKGVALHTLN